MLLLAGSAWGQDPAQAVADQLDQDRPAEAEVLFADAWSRLAVLVLALQRTLGRVFPELWAVSIPGSWNVMLLARGRSDRPLPPLVPDALEPVRRNFRGGLLRLARDPEGGMLLTDDHAPLEHLARRL